MGFVYILSNDNSPNIIKIGKTTKEPIFRVQQLNRQTGVIGNYKLEWSKECEDIDILEKVLHYIFRDFRIKKEFFEIDLEEAIKAAEKVINAFLNIENSLDSKMFDEKRIEVLKNKLPLVATKEEEKKIRVDIAKVKLKELSKQIEKLE